MAEDDWKGWTALMERIGDKVQIVGDDLFTTNPTLIRQGIDLKAANSVLIKLNQIGTVTETLEAIRLTQETGWGVVISHRSRRDGGTRPCADLAVGTASGQIKAGAPSRGESAPQSTTASCESKKNWSTRPSSWAGRHTLHMRGSNYQSSRSSTRSAVRESAVRCVELIEYRGRVDYSVVGGRRDTGTQSRRRRNA